MCFGILIEYSSLFDKDDVTSDTPLEKRKTTTGLFFLAFSITRNVSKIFNDPSPAKNTSLCIFEGIRVLTMFWVIVVHGYSTLLYNPTINYMEIKDFYSPWFFAIVQGGIYSIDVFLFISAFLGCYLLLMRSNCIYGRDHPMYNGVDFLMAYFHRVYRLFPPMVLFIILFMTFFLYIGDGPVWVRLVSEAIDGCKEHWWSHFLFIGNLYPWDHPNRCLNWLWFIS